jgi:predicted amidohydrolase
MGGNRKGLARETRGHGYTIRKIKILPSHEYEFVRKSVGKPMKVAAVQMEPRLYKEERILEKVCDFLKIAVSEGASLVVFPELCLTGLMKATSETVPGPSTEALATEAKEYGVYIVAGLLEKYKEKFYNTAVLIGPSGIIGKYRKIHPWYPSEDIIPVEPGDLGYPVFTTSIGKIGMMICYDAWFPEPARVLAIKGAEIIAIPTHTGLYSMFDYILRTRALENHVWIVASNAVAIIEEEGMAWRIVGKSQVVSIFGEVLAEASSEKEEIINAEIDARAATHDKQLLPGTTWEKSDLFRARKQKTYDVINE